MVLFACHSTLGCYTVPTVNEEKFMSTVTDSVEAQDTQGNLVTLVRSRDSDGRVYYILGGESLNAYAENGMLVLRNRNGRTFFLLTEEQ